MDRTTRIRLSVGAVVLAPVYFYLLVLIIGRSSALGFPDWWLGAFESRHFAMRVWIIGNHTVAVLAAAMPIAIAACLIARNHAIQLAFAVGVLGTGLAVLPSLSPTIWPIIWKSQPTFFITDNLKILLAVPLLTWINRKIFPKRPASQVSMSQPA